MNKTILIGRLTKDLELKHTNTDIAVCQFTIAVNRQYQKGEEKQADFINCVVWKQQAENLCKYMHKGSLIGLEGRIETRSYNDTNGVRKFITEVQVESIEFLESKNSNSNSQYQAPQNQMPNQESKPNNDPFENLKGDLNVSNDDLPF